MLVQKYGSNTKLADEIGHTAGYISQLINKRRPITEKTARKFEKALGLKEGWFDLPLDEELDHTPGASAAEEADDASRYAILAREIESLPPDLRAVVMISMGRDPDEPLPAEMTESVRRMLDFLADMIRQAREREG